MDTQKRWADFTSRLGAVRTDTLDRVILPRYNEGHRKYHNLSHIAACLGLLDDVVPSEHRDIIELAIWFHDVVYDTTARDNEERSAVLMREEAGKMHLDPGMIEDATAMILATKSHAPPEGASEALAYCLDIDMSILGSAPDVYDVYEKAIRTEYEWVPEEFFKTERAKILRGFLGLQWIYHTEAFRRTHESAARENLRRALEHL